MSSLCSQFFFLETGTLVFSFVSYWSFKGTARMVVKIKSRFVFFCVHFFSLFPVDVNRTGRIRKQRLQSICECIPAQPIRSNTQPTAAPQDWTIRHDGLLRVTRGRVRPS